MIEWGWNQILYLFQSRKKNEKTLPWRCDSNLFHFIDKHFRRCRICFLLNFECRSRFHLFLAKPVSVQEYDISAVLVIRSFPNLIWMHIGNYWKELLSGRPYIMNRYVLLLWRVYWFRSTLIWLYYIPSISNYIISFVIF